MQEIQRHKKLCELMPNGKPIFDSNQEKGIFIKHLLKLNYFKLISNEFGISQIVLYIKLHMLELYILRQGKMLLDQLSQYVFVSGQINFNGVQYGDIIDIQKTPNCIALKDCYFIKIKKNSKNWKIIKQSQSKKQIILKTYQRKLQYDQQKNNIFQQLQKADFFSQLSYYDLVELIINSSVHNVQKNVNIFSIQELVQKISYIVQGQIRLQSSCSEENKIDDLIKKYKIDFHSTKKGQYSKIVSKKQWIGLQELFQNQHFYRLNGYVTSKQAKILQIPLNKFLQKFNLISCFQTMSKLKGLVKSKTIIIQKSLQAQRKLKNNNQAQNKFNHKFDNKLKSLNNKEYSQKNKIQSQNKKEKATQFIPETIIHKFNSVKKNSILQVSQQNLNLFPQQYNSSFVYPNQRRQIDLAKQKKDRDQMKYFSPRDHKLACKNKQKLHQQASSQNILFFLTRKSTENYIMQSTFYKANQDNLKYSNLNNKTIQLLQVVQRKKSIQKQKSKDNFYLPYLLSNRSSSLNFNLETKQARIGNSYKNSKSSNDKQDIKMHSNIQNSFQQLYKNKILGHHRGKSLKYQETLHKQRNYLTIN